MATQKMDGVRYWGKLHRLPLKYLIHQLLKLVQCIPIPQLVVEKPVRSVSLDLQALSDEP